MKEVDKKILEKQGYRFTGKHSSVKICSWTKTSLKNKGECYKQKFYGINTHQCVQMTPSMVCSNRCIYCWRSMDYFTADSLTSLDTPQEIFENAIKFQKELISGLGGNSEIDKIKFKEANKPKHFAISLTGEPTIYPKLNELLELIHKNKMTSFLVTNGQFPEALSALKEMPTQLYLSLDAPTKELYLKIDNPLLKDYWERLNKTLNIISKLKTRRVIRITAVKDINMINEEDYSLLIKKANPDWVEVKGYSWVGESRSRLTKENIPSFEDCFHFAEKLAKSLGMQIIDTHKRSRAILLAKKETKERILNFD